MSNLLFRRSEFSLRRDQLAEIDKNREPASNVSQQVRTAG